MSSPGAPRTEWPAGNFRVLMGEVEPVAGGPAIAGH